MERNWQCVLLLLASVVHVSRCAACPAECSVCGTDAGTGDIISVECTGYSPINLDASIKVAKLSDFALRSTELTVNYFQGKANLEYVQLKNFGIETLASDVFVDNTALTTLDLSVNNIVTITTTTFTSSPSLTELILDSNALTTVDDNAFSTISGLQKLSLANNNISNLSDNVLYGLRNLKQLDLSNNKLTSISSIALSMASTLTSLDLSGNYISSLGALQFNNLISLSVLSIQKNDISSISGDAFNGTSIAYLDISDNNIHAVPFNSLSAIKDTLNTLKLAGNTISRIDESKLIGYTLDILDFSNNSLSSLGPLVFDGAVINVTNLENNNIESFSADLLTFLSQSSSVYLSGNPWLCDCDTMWLTQSVRDAPYKFLSENASDPVCASPSKYVGTSLQTVARNLEEECLTTTPPTTVETTTLPTCPLECSNCETDPVSGQIVKVVCSGISPRALPNTLKEMILSDYQVRSGALDTILFAGKVLLERVELKNFGIESLASDVFSDNTNLTVLRLEQNPMSTLTSSMFASVSNLQELYLNNNSITSVPDDVFSSLGNLKKLGLAGNLLNTISENAFRRLNSLQSLDVSDNQLRRVNPTPLQNILSVRSLNFTGNNIASLNVGDLANLANLQTLYLSENQIDHVDADVFRGMPLEELDMNTNILSAVPSSIRDVSSTLKILNLSKNRIQNIAAGELNNLNLDLLDLSNNSLTSFDTPMIGNSNINVTSLENNNIESFSADLLTFLSKSSSVYLSGNPWLCDCDTMWLTQSVRDAPYKFLSENASDPVCASPSKYVGTSLHSVARNLEEECLTTTPPTTVETTTLPTCPLECSNCETDPVSGQIVKVVCSGISPRALPNTLKEMILSDYQVRSGALDTILFAGKVLLERVELKNFGIESLASDVFSDNTNLTVLRLEQNPMSTLTSSMFASVSNLQELYLNNNSITSVPDDVFSSLGNLKKLGLAGNLLNTISENAFRRLNSLQSLDVSDNQLRRVNPTPLQNILSVRSLNFTGNNIASLNVGDLANLANLQTLYLSENQIDHVDADVFRGMPLEELDMNTNVLSAVPSSIRDVSSTLKILNLSKNRIQNIAAGELNNLNLDLLDLSNNSLTSFDTPMIGNSNINVTSLENNNIESFSADLLTFLSKSSSVYLSGNPWLCDCDTMWLTQSVRDAPYKFLSENASDPVCASPSKYVGTSLQTVARNLEEECLTTTPPTTVETTTLPTCPLECSNCETDPVSGQIVKVVCSGISPRALPNTLKEMILSDYQVRSGALDTILFAGKVLLERVELKNFGIESLASDVFSDNTNLTVLRLEQNPMSTLTSSMFASVSNLQELYLNNNSITSVPDDVFSSLGNLKKLGLAGNLLNTISENAFRRLNSLQSLDVSDNQLRRVNPTPLQNILSVRSLNFTGNNIASLNVGDLANLANLQTLYLSENQIDHVDADVFRGMPLEELDMNTNILSAVPSSIRDVSSTLKILNLSKNRIQNIAAGELNNLNLDLLDLSNNSLTSFDTPMIGNSNINVTSLENNNIESFSADLLTFLSKSSSVYLSGNPWLCDCDTMWLTQSVRDAPYKFLSENASDPVCASPSKYVGTSLQTVARNLEEECLTTTPPTTVETTTLPTCPLECSNCETDPVSGQIVKVVCSGISPRALPNTLKEMILSDYQVRSGALDTILFAGKVLLERVELKNFGIESLASDVFSDNTNLTVLRLEQNPMSTLTSSMFASVSNLQELYLNNNSITSVPDDVFSSLGNLKKLGLAGNLLNTISENAFRRLNSLQSLDVSDNQLRRVNPTPLQNILSVRSLNFTGNNIASLNVGDLANLANLQTLYLSENQIDHVDADVLRGMPLEELDMNTNILSAVPSSIRDVSSTLKILNLSKNRIQSIAAGELNNLNLDLLDLSNNSLTSFDTSMIGNSNINVTTLENNNIESFSADLLTFLSQSSSVYLSGNPWLCDCDTMWLTQSVRDAPYKFLFENASDPVCASPSKYVGTSLQTVARNLEEECLTTTPPTTVETTTLPTCPLECSKCETDPVSGQIVKVVCSGISPVVVPNTVQEMTLSDYVIRGGIMDGSFLANKGNLKSVTLTNYGITSFATGTFRDTPLLQRVTVSNSNLAVIPENVFENMTSLQQVSLTGNRLTELSFSTLTNLSSLMFLDLSNNSFTSFDSSSMATATSLQGLSLAQNKLTSLTSQMFSSLQSLQILILFDNQISQISDQAFADTPLIQLNLANNNLTSFPSRALNSVSNSLRIIDIADNMISQLENFVCPGLELSELILAGNRISTIDDNAFVNCTVGITDLEANSLTTVSPFFKDFVLRSDSVYISENPWVCDCNSAWFAEFIRDIGSVKYKRFTDAPDPDCGSPSDFERTYLKDAAGRLEVLCQSTTILPSTDHLTSDVFMPSSIVLAASSAEVTHLSVSNTESMMMSDLAYSAGSQTDVLSISVSTHPNIVVSLGSLDMSQSTHNPSSKDESSIQPSDVLLHTSDSIIHSVSKTGFWNTVSAGSQSVLPSHATPPLSAVVSSSGTAYLLDMSVAVQSSLSMYEPNTPASNLHMCSKLGDCVDTSQMTFPLSISISDNIPVQSRSQSVSDSHNPPSLMPPSDVSSVYNPRDSSQIIIPSQTASDSAVSQISQAQASYVSSLYNPGDSSQTSSQILLAPPSDVSSVYNPSDSVQMILPSQTASDIVASQISLGPPIDVSSVYHPRDSSQIIRPSQAASDSAASQISLGPPSDVSSVYNPRDSGQMILFPQTVSDSSASQILLASLSDVSSVYNPSDSNQIILPSQTASDSVASQISLGPPSDVSSVYHPRDSSQMPPSASDNPTLLVSLRPYNDVSSVYSPRISSGEAIYPSSNYFSGPSQVSPTLTGTTVSLSLSHNGESGMQTNALSSTEAPGSAGQNSATITTEFPLAPMTTMDAFGTHSSSPVTTTAPDTTSTDSIITDKTVTSTVKDTTGSTTTTDTAADSTTTSDTASGITTTSDTASGIKTTSDTATGTTTTSDTAAGITTTSDTATSITTTSDTATGTTTTSDTASGIKTTSDTATGTTTTSDTAAGITTTSDTATSITTTSDTATGTTTTSDTASGIKTTSDTATGTTTISETAAGTPTTSDTATGTTTTSDTAAGTTTTSDTASGIKTTSDTATGTTTISETAAGTPTTSDTATGTTTTADTAAGTTTSDTESGITTTSDTATGTTTTSDTATATTEKTSNGPPSTESASNSQAATIAGAVTGTVALITVCGAVIWKFKLGSKLCPKSTATTSSVPSGPSQPPTTTQPPAAQSSTTNSTGGNNNGGPQNKPANKLNDMPEVERESGFKIPKPRGIAETPPRRMVPVMIPPRARVVEQQVYHEVLQLDLSVITTHRISELTSRTSITCARACCNTDNCALFNINSNDGLCLLFSTSFSSGFNRNIPVGGRLYWRVSDKCPIAEGYMAFDNPPACYRLSRDRKTQTDAKVDCESDGGHLAVLEDLDKRQQVMEATAVFRETECVLVGLDDLDTVGTHVWADGRDLSNKFWKGGHPHFGTRCVVLCQLGIQSHICDSSSYYMCQIDLLP
ncbi:serine-rich adhesin for platelets-like [Haliotis asinina]|uniref:serine-rich adhesin for platelets-like n=1 Tax=Haliotis asinina TaxID=109174 RepID=UPI003532795E